MILVLVQELRLRGQKEDNSSKNKAHFLEVVELFLIYDETLSEHFNKHISYCSPKVKNEIIQIIVQLSLMEQ